MMDGGDTRPDITVLGERQRERVRAGLRRSRLRCPSCGTRKLDVGNALFLGFLFRSEDQDAYVVAVTCKNPTCPAPRSGIRLRGSDLLSGRPS